MNEGYSLKGRVLRALLARRGATLVQTVGTEAAADLATIRETRTLVPLLVQDAAGLGILAAVRACRRLGGSMAEAGVFAGGTARLICEAKGDAALHLFDVFETLQRPANGPEGERAIELRRHFRTLHAPRAQVERLLAPYPAVHTHAGIFPDSARGLEGERFSFVHIDLDLEPSTRDALAFFYPRLATGGIIIGDDYAAPAVRQAFANWFRDRPDPLVALPWGQVVVVKVT